MMMLLAFLNNDDDHDDGDDIDNGELGFSVSANLNPNQAQASNG